MKWKITIFALFALLFSSYVSAACFLSEPGLTICYFDNYGPNNGVYNTTMPFIKVNFQEIPVTITEFSLYSINDSVYKDIDRLSPQTGINFTFRSPIHLPNRKYEFFFKAEDQDNNIILTYINFTIKVNQTDVWVTKPTNIYVPKPKFAFGYRQNFTLELELQRRGNCGFRTTGFTNPNLSEIYGNGQPGSGSLLAYFTQIPNSNRIVIPNFNFPQYWPDAGLNGEASNGDFIIIYVVCREDGGERFAYEEILIGADLTPPVIGMQAIPSPVIDGNDRNTTLTITLNDHSVCTVKSINTPNDGSDPIVDHPPGYPFDSLNQFKFVIPEHIRFPGQPASYDYRFNVTCDNLANNRSSSIFTIPVNLQTAQNIEFHSPNTLLKTKSVDVNVSTQIYDQNGCRYSIENSNGNTSLQDMGPRVDIIGGNRNLYSKKGVSLVEGENKIKVVCSPMTTFTTRTVEVDTTPPPVPTISALDNTCGFSRLKFTIKNGTDNRGGSGFDYYAYNVTLSNDPDNDFGFSGTTTSGVVDKAISGSLIENKTFTISAWSVDEAGNSGLRATKTVKVTNNKLAVCDLNSPEIKFTKKQDNVTKFWTVIINCTDSQSGCQPNYNYNVLFNTTESCISYPSSRTLGESVTIEKTARFCAIVKDQNNNNDTVSEFITVKFPPSCSNDIKDGDETGLNCGGSCPACELNLTCIKDSDCESGYCKAGYCSIPSCTDGIKNGDESDKDCGGSICSPCGDNSTCEYDYDCSSGNCELNKCVPPSCTNQKKDGTETDYNCGGDVCEACPDGKICKINSDCESNYCDPTTKKCDIDPTLDSDGDGLPDWWEIKYCGCATCCDPDDDLDGDDYTNLEEYENGTNPIDPLDKPDFFKLNPIALILLILGVLAIGAGIFLLYSESNKRKMIEEEAEQKRFQQAMSSGPRPVIIGDPDAASTKPVQRQLTPEQIALRERLKKQSQNQKSTSRKSVLDEFDVGGTSSQSKPTPVIQKKPQPAIKSATIPATAKVANTNPVKPAQGTQATKPVLEQKPLKQEPEDDVFAKLKKVAEKNKKSK